ncbi:MAG: hypothetical protein ACE5JP_11755 [Candidatus Bipolaricaulia bacterium]
MGEGISIALVALVTVVGFILLGNSLGSPDPLQMFLNPTELQLDAMLIIVMGLIVLSQYLEGPVNITQIREQILSLQHVILNPQAKLPSTEEIPFSRKVATVASQIIGALLLIMSFIILLIDLVGGFPGDFSDMGPLLKKFTLVTVGVMFVLIVLARNKELRVVSERLIETLNFLRQSGTARAVQVVDRAGLHEFLYESLDSYTPDDIVYISDFEELYAKFKEYYYKDFMRKWWQVLREVGFEVKQVVLLNSKKDMEDLKARVEDAKDIDQYFLSALVAPPLTLFFDMVVLSGKYVLLCISRDARYPNFISDAIIIHSPEIVKVFEDLFTRILLNKSVPIKTKEGINFDNLDEVESEIKRIGKSRVLKPIFRER